MDIIDTILVEGLFLSNRQKNHIRSTYNIVSQMNGFLGINYHFIDYINGKYRIEFEFDGMKSVDLIF